MSAEAPTPCRVFVVDDHPAVREGLALVLGQQGITICGEAAGGEQTLRVLDSARPDLVVVDLNLQNENGLALIGELHARAVPVLVYSMYEDSLHIRQAFAAGSSGYVTKREAGKVLVQAIREVLAGRRFISERAETALLEANADVDQSDVVLGKLSERELQVLQWVGQGDTGDDIARKLHISPRTVASYYGRIITKLDLAGMKELRRYAIQKNREAR